MLVNIQLPDSSSLERTQASHQSRSAKSPSSEGRVRHRGNRRPVVALERVRVEFRHDVRHAEGVQEAACSGGPAFKAENWVRQAGIAGEARCSRRLLRNHHEQAAWAARQGHSRGEHRDLRPPAAARRGSGRRLDADDRGSRRPGLSATPERSGEPRQQAAGIDGDRSERVCRSRRTSWPPRAASEDPTRPAATDARRAMRVWHRSSAPTSPRSTSTSTERPA